MHMTQMQKQQFKQKAHWLLVFLYILWIFSNSFMNGDISSNTSGSITRQILSVLSSMGIHLSYDVFHHFIRKAAHFCEYALLGFITCLAIRKKSLLSSEKLTWIAFCVIPPLMDETIQLFIPGRTGALKDSLLDMCGYVSGSLFLYICTKTYRHLKKDNKQ